MKSPKKTVGILTAGGDCPGPNAVIRAAVRKGFVEYGIAFAACSAVGRECSEGVGELKMVGEGLFDIARVFFG